MCSVSATAHFTITCLSYVLCPLPAAIYLVVRSTVSLPRAGIDAPLLGSAAEAVAFLALLVSGIAVAWAVPRFVVVARCPECGGRARYDGKAPSRDWVVYRCTACGDCIRTGWPSAGGGMP